MFTAVGPPSVFCIVTHNVQQQSQQLPVEVGVVAGDSGECEVEEQAEASDRETELGESENDRADIMPLPVPESVVEVYITSAAGGTDAMRIF